MSHEHDQLLRRLFDAVRAPEARHRRLAELVEAANASPIAAYDTLARHDLLGVWREGLQAAGAWGEIDARLRARIDDQARLRLANHLLQRRAASLAAGALERAGLRYLFMKGLHVQEAIYDSPMLRPMADLDLLVPRERRTAALRTLAEAGFGGTPLPTTVSHEIALRGHGIELDVHWGPFRPGRSRVRMGPELLSARQKCGDFWVPSDAHATWLLLVHPAVTEHVTMRLMRAVDLDRWARRRNVPWHAARELLRRSGLATAAWVMATWTQGWLGTPLPGWFLDGLAPSSPRRAYLRAWLRRDPARRFNSRPHLVRGAFALALQDNTGDAIRAVVALGSVRRSAARDCRDVTAALAMAGDAP